MNVTLLSRGFFQNLCVQFALVIAFTGDILAQTDITILEQPQCGPAQVGTTVTLSVKAVSASGEPLSYRWFYDKGTFWADAYQTNSFYGVEVGFESMRYLVVVSNSTGSITSAPVVVTSAPVVVQASGVAVWNRSNTQLWPIPANIGDLVSIEAAGKSTFAVTADGFVKTIPGSWSVMVEGPGVLDLAARLSISYHIAVLYRDTTVHVLGFRAPEPPSGLSNVVAVSLGDGFAMALKSDGDVVIWGTQPLLGDTPDTVHDVVAVAAGKFHALALRGNGTVVGWGGSPDSGSSDVPEGLCDVVAISASDFQSFAIRSDGSAAIWGKNPSLPLLSTPDLKDVVAISGASGLNLGLSRDGSVIGWNPYSATPPTLPGPLTNVTDISVSDDVVMVLMGPRPPSFIAPIPSREAPIGAPVNLIASATGSQPLSYQWFFNGVNIVGETNRVLRFAQAQEAHSGLYTVTVMNSIGEVSSPPAELRVYGVDFREQPQPFQTWVGGGGELKVTADSRLPISYQWFHDGTALPEQTTNVLMLVNLGPEGSGEYWVLASNALQTVTSDKVRIDVLPLLVNLEPENQRVFEGTTALLSAHVEGQGPFTYQWQQNGSDLPGWTESTATIEDAQIYDSGMYRVVVSNIYGSVVSPAVKLDVAPWPKNPSIPPEAVSALMFREGVSHVIALMPDTTVLTWGDNYAGQLDVPPGLAGVSQIDAGNLFTLALLTNGTVVAWGAIDPPPALSNVVAIAAGSQHALALLSDGTIAAWGINWDGQTQVPATATNIVAIAAGHESSLALTQDGELISWGNPFYEPPVGLNDLVAIASGRTHFLALTSVGTVVGWGHNYAGQVNTPPGLSNVVAIAGATGLSIALREDGSLESWGSYWLQNSTNMPSGMTNVISLSTLQGHIIPIAAYGAPYVTVQPCDQAVTLGQEVSLVSKFVSKQTVSCKWQFNGKEIPGATNSTYKIDSARPEQEGIYAALLSNGSGSTLTRKAKLTVVGQLHFPQLEAQFHMGDANAVVRLILRSNPGTVLEVQRSPDLIQWNGLDRVTNWSGTVVINDEATAPSQFYRVKQVPGQ